MIGNPISKVAFKLAEQATEDLSPDINLRGFPIGNIQIWFIRMLKFFIKKSAFSFPFFPVPLSCFFSVFSYESKDLQTQRGQGKGETCKNIEESWTQLLQEGSGLDFIG